MNKKRLIITSIISIILVSILFIGSTYSIFTTGDIDENANVYTTGVLDITYTVSSDNIKLQKSTPISNEEITSLKPYRITITNNGNVPYKFNVILNNTTATTSINTNYIMTKVGKLEPISLGSTTNNIIKSDIIINPNSNVDIDVRIYIKEDIPNSEIGKNFSATLSISGLAVYNDEPDIDNSDLIANYTPLLSSVEPGSYVAYIGNNGCTGNSCQGYNANYVSDTDMGYCNNSSYKFTVNGWRVGYISEGTVYLVSAGAPECIATDADGNMDNSGSDTSNYLDSANLYKHLDNLDNEALLYCNLGYAYGGVCDSTSTWAMDATDFEAITGSALSNSSCYLSPEDTNCGYGNDLIDNGGYYWYATHDTISFFLWHPNARRVSATTGSSNSTGLRPVLRLQSSVRVTGGSGTYTDPYTIAN